ncbi:hypothetical protein V8D89_011862 [Ganoderma adspersum]
MGALALICEFLADVSDVISFALTYGLLTMRPILLYCGTSIHRFHPFLFTNVCARAPHIYTINIGSRPRPCQRQPAAQDGNYPLLPEIVTSCSHLQCVAVVLKDVPHQRATRPRPSIIDTIADIRTLRSLSVRYGWSMDTLVLLHKVRAPFRVLSIYSPNPETNSWSPATLEKFLPRFAPTLEKLELCNFRIDPEETQGLGTIPARTRSIFHMAQYPAMQSFSACSLEGAPLLEALRHLFPAPDGTLRLGVFGTWVSEGAFARMRATNQRGQEGHSPGTGPWTKLDRVSCDVSNFTKQPRSPTETVAQAEVRLTVFDGLLSPEMWENLTHLTLFILDTHTSGMYGEADVANVVPARWNAVLDKMIPSLQYLVQLTHLRVVLHSRTRRSPWTRVPLAGVEETMAAVVPPLSSLEYIFTTAGYLADRRGGSRQGHGPWDMAWAWRVVRLSGADGMPDTSRNGLTELHEDVAETIIRREELVLSRADEAVLYRHFQD